MTTTTIKVPTTVRDFWQFAHDLGMEGSDLMGELERVYGESWMEQYEDLAISVSTLGVQESGEVIAPAGYELAEGCSDYYVSPKAVSSAFAIRQGWNAADGVHCIEVAPSDGLGEMQMLSPDDAMKLAADLTAAVGSIRPVNIAAPVPAGV